MKVLKQLSAAVFLTLSMSSAFAEPKVLTSIDAYSFKQTPREKRPSVNDYCALKLENITTKRNKVDGGSETRLIGTLTLFSQTEGKFIQIVSNNQFTDVVEATVVNEYQKCNNSTQGIKFTSTNTEVDDFSLIESAARTLGNSEPMQK